MKKVISLILICFMLVPNIALAEEAVIVTEGVCRDGLFWRFSDGTLTISGEGEMAHYMEIRGPWDGQYQYFFEKPWADFSEDVREVHFEKGVTHIGSHSFIDCVNLERVVLGSAETIGADAFTGTKLKEIVYCNELMGISSSALKDTPLEEASENIIVDGRYLWKKGGFTESRVVIPDGVKVIGIGLFKNSDVSEVILPEGLEVIGKEAFWYCDNLVSLKIPDSVRIIGERAFEYSHLTEYNMPENIEYVGMGAFCSSNIKSFTIKSGVEYGEADSFYNCGICQYCDNLTEVIIEDGVTVIPTEFASGCKGLKAVEIPDSVKEIKSRAFSGTGITEAVFKKDVIYGDAVFSNTFVTMPELEDGITRIPGGAFSNLKNLEEITIPQSVTSIGQDAFRGCMNLKSITIPETVTSIGNGAFSECDALTLVSIPKSCTNLGSEAFSGCDSLIEVQIKSNLTSVNDSLFKDCTSLKKVNIPVGVKSIGNSAFYGCQSLESIHLFDNVEKIGQCAFYNCESLKKITLPSKVTAIENETFYACYRLEKIKLPKNLKSIGRWAFYNCSILEEIYLPGGLESIGANAFYECAKLKTISIPKSVTYIDGNCFGKTAYCNDPKNWKDGMFYVNTILLSADNKLEGEVKVKEGTTIIARSAFSGDRLYSNCGKITRITLPDSVKVIDDYAFEKCWRLETINLPEGLERIGSRAFYDCEVLKAIYIPESVTFIGASAFLKCISLREVNIPKNIKVIKSSVFSDCISLTEITLPDGLVEIGYGAFNNCRELRSITIPESVTKIGSYAFYDCGKLSKIEFLGEIPRIDDKAFQFIGISQFELEELLNQKRTQ